MSAKFELIAPCFFGCEATANFELRRIGAENIRVSDGRLTFSGGPEMIAAANLNLRTVERVLLLLNTYPASTFDELFDGVYAIPWEEFLPADAAFPVTGSSLNSQLTSVPACQSIIKKAVVKRLMTKHHTSVLPETGAEYKIRFMLRKNVCEIMLDTTGDGLHKRGYRRNAMEAPIRETLAATIADLGRVRRDSLVEDPFCGSGTLLIEAAQKAMNIAPGLKRRFAAERYSFVPVAIWAQQRQKALAESKLDVGFEAFGYDIDPAAVALANANAKLAGVEKRCHFEVADVSDFEAKAEAIVLTNPPYGERMSTIEGAAKLARTLGRQMEAHPCAGVYAITADMEFESHYGKRANKRRKMYNGMIPCRFRVGLEIVFCSFGFPVPIGWTSSKPFAAFSLQLFHGANLPARVLCVQFVRPVADGVKIIAAFHRRIYTVVDCNEPHVLLREINFHVGTDLQVLAAKA